jgi:molybdate transport system substrate-binding protein
MRALMRRRASLPGVLLFPLALSAGGCSGGEEARAPLLVGAASDLAAAMPALAEAFERSSGARVSVTLGSTGQLANQVLQGAPVDVFLSADASWVDRLEAAGRLEPGARAVYAYGVLVLLAGRAAEPPAAVPDLERGEYARIALANPEHAPYGRAARQALERAGVLSATAARLILAENVRQTVQFAEAGAVDVAISALSLMDGAKHRWTEVPQELHEPLTQTVAVVAGSRNAAAARGFAQFMVSAEARAILQRYRFVLPE